MNEVENHYATQGNGSGHGRDKPEPASGAVGAAKAAVEQAKSTAKDGLKSVAGQAKAATRGGSADG